MENVKKRIAEIKNQGYPFDFGTTFNHAIEIYKKIAVPAGLAFLIFGVLISVLVMGYVFTSIDWQHASQDPEQFDITKFSTIGVISYAVAMILLTALAVPLSAGLMKMCYEAEKGQEVSLGTAFIYYSGTYFVDLFLAGLLIGGFNILLSILFEFLGVGFVGSILSILIGVFTALFVPLIIFGNLRPLDAIASSFIVVSKQFFLILLLVIVGWLISICGVIACCVGIFFTMPVMYAIHYSIYVHSVGIEDNAETSGLS